MEFTISKTDFVRELVLATSAAERKTTIPILANILIQANGEGISLTGTDLELGIRCACPANIKKSGSSTIPARKLLEYVKLLPDADIQIKITDNNWASLVCGRARTRIAGISADSFPTLPGAKEPIAVMPLPVLTDLISNTIFAISTEESRFTLNGALLILEERSLTMVATDGHRLAVIQKEANLPGVSVRALIPMKALREIQKLAKESTDGTAELSQDENHLFFQIGTRLLLTRKLTGNFPDYQRILPQNYPHILVLSREEMTASIERVSRFSDERSHCIRLSISEGQLKFYSSTMETGESEEILPVEYEGSDVDLGFNASYLLDFLRNGDSSEIELHFKDGQSAGELRPAGTADYRYVVMPLRV